MARVDISLVRWALRTASEFKLTPQEQLDAIASKSDWTAEELMALHDATSVVSAKLELLAQALRKSNQFART